MQRNTHDKNIRFEPELGEHNIGEDIESSNIKNKYDFEVESETVFKRLATDIYNGKKAGIREPLTNGITAIFKAIEDGYMENASEGIILFELYESNNDRRLKIRDNGVGMTRDEIDEIISVIGTSTSRSSYNLTGKFGMGFLATWMLVGGVKGGFIMHTNPRGVEEGPISGIWNSKSFFEYDTDVLTGGLKKDEYGTEFDIMIGTDIDTKDIINWIYKYSKWSRVPVLFRHYTDDGVTDEEFMPTKITDRYENIANGDIKQNSNITIPDEFKYYVVESEYFKAVNSNLKVNERGLLSRPLNNIILLDVPIDNVGELKNNRKYPLKSLEIRINSETPVVVDGPHKGKYVVSESESENLGDEYISEELLTVDDIITPSPTGTRDMLENTEEFSEWLSEKFYEIHYDEISTLVRKIYSLDDYYNLLPEERDEFHNKLLEICDADYNLKYKDISQVESRAKTTFNERFKKMIPYLHKELISVAPKGKKGISKMSNRQNESVKELFLDTYNADKTVYMGHRLTQQKAEFIWAADKNHYVVRVASENQEKYKKHFGWKSISDLDFETSLEMSDEKREQFLNPEINVEDKKIKIHVNTYSTIKNVKASKIKNIVKNKDTLKCDEDNSKYEIHKLIIFKRGQHSVSNHKDMVSDVVATASVPSDVYDYLIDSPNIWGAEKAINKTIELPASDGKTYDISNDIKENIVTHIVDEETLKDFRKPEFLKNIGEYIKKHKYSPENAVYIPMSRFEYEFAFDKNHDGKFTSSRNNVNTQDMSGTSIRSITTTDVKLYMEAFVDEETPEVKALKTVSTKWSEGGKEIVKMFEKNRP